MVVNKKEIEDLIYYETDQEMLLMDGFESAFIGLSKRCSQPILATYSFTKMLQVLIERDGMDVEEAAEYIEYNCTGAWMGELTPVILYEVEEGNYGI